MSAQKGSSKDDYTACGTYKGEDVSFLKLFPYIVTTLEDLQTFETRDSDVWLLTYMNTGTNWVYEVISILLGGELKERPRFNDEFIEVFPDIKALDKLSTPRILNTHLRLKYLPMDKIMKGKVVATVRNPKSTAVSNYNFLSKLKDATFTGTFDEFLQSTETGICSTYGDWFQYTLDSWEQLHGKDNVFYIFFEELKQNPVAIIQQLSKFLGVKRDRSFCEGVAKLTSFEHMAKQSGKTEEQKKEITAYFTTGKNEMFRKGTIDDWKNHYTVAQNERFDKMYHTNMEKYPELKQKIKFENDS